MNFSNIKLIAVVSLIVFSLMSLNLSNKVYACSCIIPEDTLTEASKTDNVFIGTVTNSVIPEDRTGAGEIEYTVSVTETFKGELNSEVKLYTASSSAACGVNLEKDKEYLIFTNEYEGKLNVSLCSGTALTSAKPDDVIQLQNNDIPTDPVTEPRTPRGDDLEPRNNDVDDVKDTDKNDKSDKSYRKGFLFEASVIILLGLNIFLTIAILVRNLDGKTDTIKKSE